VRHAVGLVLAVDVPVVQVVDVIGVHHRLVSTPGAMGVAVGLGRLVLGRGAHCRISLRQGWRT